MGYHQDDWYDWLDIAEFVQNDHVYSSTHQTPFFLTYGHHSWKGQQTGHVSISPDAESFHQKMLEIHSEARAALTIAADTMKFYYDRTKGASISYVIGSEVWLEGRHLSSYRPTKKFEDRRYGPFTILAKVGKASYTLDLPKDWKGIHPTFNEVLLTPYVPPAFPGQARPAPPPPIDIEGHPEFEVDTILRSRHRPGRPPRNRPCPI